MYEWYRNVQRIVEEKLHSTNNDRPIKCRAVAVLYNIKFYCYRFGLRGGDG